MGRGPPAHLPEARRDPVGAGPGRDPADPDGQRPARPDRRPGGRADEDRPRRGHRCPARGRGVRLRHRPAGGLGLHHDAGLPPRHLPGRDRHPEPGAARALTGTPEFVETFFEYIAEEVREYLAALGLRSLEEAIGRVDLLDAAAAVDHWKAAGSTSRPILPSPTCPTGRSATAYQRPGPRPRAGARPRLPGGAPPGHRRAAPGRPPNWRSPTLTARWAPCSATR